jgi:hypothetical protein
MAAFQNPISGRDNRRCSSGHQQSNREGRVSVRNTGASGRYLFSEDRITTNARCHETYKRQLKQKE